jgi:dihydroorotate dehydrogenase electron transfer subunit
MAASTTANAARCRRARLVGKRACGPDAFVGEVELGEDPGPVAPGQFAMLSPGDDSGPCIARPFSVFDRTSARRFTFLVQVLGPGTRALAAVPVGGDWIVMMPLGNGFDVAPTARRTVFVAGGVGSAPFLLYARARTAEGAGGRTWMLYGARTADRLYDRDAFESEGVAVLCATQDGSAGARGTVLELLARELDAGRIPGDALFCGCGPEGLLHAFAAFARARGLAAELSLETYMGCGWGGCNACPVPTEPTGALGAWPWAKTCTQGPVFPLSDIRI